MTPPTTLDIRGIEGYLPDGLLHCALRRQPMTRTDHPTVLGYQCRPGCRRKSLNGLQITGIVGREILRQAPRLLPPGTDPYQAATHASRVLAAVTVGPTAATPRFTWRTAPASPATGHVRRLATARRVVSGNPHQAVRLLRLVLAGVDPAAPAPDDTHAQAAAHRVVGQYQQALHRYGRLAEHLVVTDGPQGHRTLATRASIALMLHRLGHCQTAHALHADTSTHRAVHRDRRPATTAMRLHLARIRRDCTTKGHDYCYTGVPAGVGRPVGANTSPSRLRPAHSDTNASRHG
ncbi:tetratricopeptide repeat protein [Micromonospora sp. WMMD1082]|uniref:tetratricopeptide repeat protein n=1 Tax=Micromonospora sp. WMMD1082 TaxID=3016104 RepID=UPI002417E427|nr:tetratricopeptide repeat protein [Micromonospora sp. WMMD1082]MDG4795192.1 tetratricopeptide repeat protein [Micromonospora sp. WMMD1082]